MSFYYYAGKALEIVGMTVAAAALFAGMGTFTGTPSMSQEMLLLGIGGVIFTFGWWLEHAR